MEHVLVGLIFMFLIFTIRQMIKEQTRKVTFALIGIIVSFITGLTFFWLVTHLKAIGLVSQLAMFSIYIGTLFFIIGTLIVSFVLDDLCKVYKRLNFIYFLRRFGYYTGVVSKK